MAFANILIGLVAIVLVMLCSLIYGDHSRSGDAGVGHAWSLVYSLGLLTILVAIIMLIVGAYNGFNWIIRQSEYRWLYLTIGYGLTMWGIVFIVIGFHGSEFSKLMQVLKGVIPLLAMLALLISLIVIVNKGKLQAISTQICLIPIYVSIGIGLLSILVSGAIRIVYSVDSGVSYVEQRVLKDQEILEQISNTQVLENWKDLIQYTRYGYSRQIQKKAVAKIKSHPNWENEVSAALSSRLIRELYFFLLQPEVDATIGISEHLSKGFKMHADLIREDIRNCHSHHSLYKGRFVNEIDMALSTAEKYKKTGIQFYQDIYELRSAFEEPTPFEKPQLEEVKILDKWLRKNGKK